MNIMGKILVILNLVMAFAVAGKSVEPEALISPSKRLPRNSGTDTAKP